MDAAGEPYATGIGEGDFATQRPALVPVSVRRIEGRPEGARLRLRGVPQYLEDRLVLLEDGAPGFDTRLRPSFREVEHPGGGVRSGRREPIHEHASIARRVERHFTFVGRLLSVTVVSTGESQRVRLPIANFPAVRACLRQSLVGEAGRLPTVE